MLASGNPAHLLPTDIDVAAEDCANLGALNEARSHPRLYSLLSVSRFRMYGSLPYPADSCTGFTAYIPKYKLKGQYPKHRPEQVDARLGSV